MVEDVVKHVVQQLLRHGQKGGLSWRKRGADGGNVDASRSNTRVGNDDATKHQVYVRVVMCWIHRYGEHICVGIIGIDGLKTRFLVWINMNGTWVGSIQ